ncbi:unnamed protein product, partial [Scytosiphon promiscuus]
MGRWVDQALPGKTNEMAGTTGRQEEGLVIPRGILFGDPVRRGRPKVVPAMIRPEAALSACRSASHQTGICLPQDRIFLGRARTCRWGRGPMSPTLCNPWR